MRMDVNIAVLRGSHNIAVPLKILKKILTESVKKLIHL